jgi:protein PhnA
MDIKVRDSNGALLAEGDSVTLIKDLKLRGSSTVLKRGTVISNIHLTDNEDEIEGRTDKVTGLVLRTEFLKNGVRGMAHPFFLRKFIFESML